MINADDAWALIADTPPLGDTETIAVAQAASRVLATDIIAKRTQPPRDVSAMDGYAVRQADMNDGLGTFTLIGEAPAGGRFEGTLKAGESVRIFTGGTMPDGADHIVIQEDMQSDGPRLTITDTQKEARHIRKAGQDFAIGDVLLRKGKRLSAADLALIANGNHAAIEVFRRPRIALIASGNELAEAGSAMTDEQIPDSNSIALGAMVESWGGELIAATITIDDKARFTEAVQAFERPDIIVPIGGASVGDYDYAKEVFYGLGFQPIFEKIAVKPGKPCWFAKSDSAIALGLPGNPASAMVTARLFLKPLIERLSSTQNSKMNWQTAILSQPLNGNGPRESFLRGTLRHADDGTLRVSVSNRQDSSLTTVFAEADCLLRRAPNAEPAEAGDVASILPL